MIQSNLRLCCALSWLLLSTEASLSVRRGAAVEPAEEAPWGHPTVSGELPWPVIERRLQQLTVVGNNGSPASAFPLGECEGDCDTDDDCDGDLICYQIDSGSVPGCSGSTTSKTDFCARPTQQSSGGNNADTVDGMTSEGGTNSEGGTISNFYVKKHWKPEFLWQETTREWKWCFQCVGEDPGSWSRLVDCDSGNPTRLTFDLIGTTNEFRIRVHGADLCLQLPATSEDYSNFELCDGSENQIWMTQGGSPFNGSPFEIQPKLLPDYCLTNTHHPKGNERLWVANCEYTRSYNTDKHEIYQPVS